MATSLTPWLPGMLFGAGVNRLNGEIKGDAVLRTPVEPPLETQSQAVRLFMKRIESLEELTENLGISVEAEGRYGLVSGSARFDYAKSTKMTEYNVYFLIRVVVTNGFQRMRDVTLKEGPKQLLAQNNSKRFREANGDSFVLGMQTGGELFAVLEFKTRSETEKESVAAGLTLSFDSFVNSASLSASISNQLDKSKTQTDVTYHLFVEPPLPDKPLPVRPNIDDIIAYASDFPAAVATRGAPFAVLLQEYEALDLPTPPNFVELAAQQENLIRMLRQRNQDTVRLDKLDFILAHPEQFEGLTPGRVVELTEKRNILASQINQVTRQAALCADNHEQCELPALSSVALDDLPPRKKEFAEDVFVVTLEQIKNTDSAAEPHFGEPLTGGIEQQDQGPFGGRFILFKSPLGNPSGGIFWHPDLGAHYVYGDTFLRYHFTGHCFGRMGYPMENLKQGFEPGVDGILISQRFQGGFITNHGDLGNDGNFLDPL